MNQLIEATLAKLVADIESGELDWKKTWRGGNAMPKNATTTRYYNGINVLLLWAAGMRHAYPTPEWATYKQWQAAGKQVAKGEKSSVIFISKDVTKKRPGEEDEHYRLWRCAYVFNAAQLTEPPAIPERKPVTIEERHARCRATVDATGARIEFGWSSPCYIPSLDRISLPSIEEFTSADAYYATVFHELVHWTKQERRCDRKPAETNAYAFEELVAEIGAAFLCAEHGIEEVADSNNQAAYLQTWLKDFDDKGTAIAKAASLASKAFAFVMEGETRMEQAA